MASTAATQAPASSGQASFDFLNVASNRQGKTYTADEQNQRFLKLLTTQLQNQDPLNPMENAEMTSQIAQISTVTGLEGLNQTVQALQSQFLTLQALQGASLVGREVAFEGNTLALSGGVGRGRVELGSAASQVRIEVLSPSGSVVKTLELGALPAGQSAFDFKATGLKEGEAYTFRAVAALGKEAVTVKTLALAPVQAVRTDAAGLTLEIGAGRQIGYGEVKAVLG